MRKIGWNPTRRNKNIGTKKQGFSQNNKFVIPDRYKNGEWVSFSEDLINPVIIPININDHELALIIEPTYENYTYSCTPQDIIKILSLFPVQHFEETDLKIIIMRQPKNKDEIVSPVWGRFSYYQSFAQYDGAAITLESMKAGLTLKWSKKLSVFSMKELDMLRNDGHQVEALKRYFLIQTTPESIRNTQLFRTIPHEIGHAYDYYINSMKPSMEAWDRGDEAEDEYISNVFNSKPQLDKEEAANRYAKEFHEKHSMTGGLPFAQIYDEDALKDMGLDPKWFRIKS